MVNSASLLTLISNSFSLDEIRNICYELGLDYEEFPERKSGLVREMLLASERTGILADVVSLCQKQRPNLIWPNLDEIRTRNDLLDESFELVTPFEPETVEIPSGEFLMGSSKTCDAGYFEQPQHTINLPRYRIGLYPITNQEYAAFINQTGRIVSPESGWPGQSPERGKLNHPVRGVTFFEALAYCEWLSRRTERSYRLPTEAEWEKAARGTDGRRYPWGDQWQVNRCHYEADTTAPVDAYPVQSIFGCSDIVGNVREWTCTLWGEKRREPDEKYRYPWAEDGRNDVHAGIHLRRVYRGGGYRDPRDRLRCCARDAYSPDKAGPPGRRHGFRVVLEVD